MFFFFFYHVQISFVLLINNYLILVVGYVNENVQVQYDYVGLSCPRWDSMENQSSGFTLIPCLGGTAV